MAHALQPQESSNRMVLPFADYAIPGSYTAWNGVVLVGEAPGAEEAKVGRPFVGRSGQLLDKLLEKAGIKREETIIANVFRYQPPANKVDHFFASRRVALQNGVPISENYGKFGNNFCRLEFAGELDYLSHMLKARQPTTVISLGRVPLWALTGENELLKKVGRPLPCRLNDALMVMPTFHPSFILRGNWGLQDEWLSHFTKALGQ